MFLRMLLQDASVTKCTRNGRDCPSRDVYNAFCGQTET